MGMSDDNHSTTESQHETLRDEFEKNVPSHQDTKAPTDDEEKVSLPPSSESVHSVKEETVKKGGLGDPSQFPDGGFDAWLCVAGAAACFFCSFGWINAVGVFQNYYVSVPLRDYSPSTVGWIVSLEVFMMLFMSPWVGLWYDNFGPRSLLIVGTLLHVFGLMMTSLATQYYQFILAQGICSAIGASMIFGPGMTCISTWFFKKRGMAIGLAAAGSSLGGVIFPIVVSRMIKETGFPWAMRTCAFIILGLMIFANFTVKSRTPPMKRKFEFMAFVRPFKEMPFLCLTIATFMFYYGLFLPFAFIVSDAVDHGMSLSLAEYLVSILNAGSIFGRTLPGIIGDKVGRFNTMIAFCSLTTILILAMWIPADTNAVFIAFAPLFGFSSGAAIGLTPALIATISPIPEIGTRMGALLGVASIAALTGTPIGGAIIDASDGKYTYAGVFAGLTCAIGVGFYLACRVSIAGWSLKKKV